jgi:phage protein D
MKPTIVFSLFALCTVALLPAHAQTYQWKDSSGRTVISDTTPPNSGKSTRTVNAPTSEPRQTEESASISEPKSTAEKDLEFKKRQQEAKEKAEKTAKEQAAAADKAENCRRAQSNLTALEAGQPMATIDASGQRVVMDSSQREQEMAHARRIVSEACK